MRALLLGPDRPELDLLERHAGQVGFAVTRTKDVASARSTAGSVSYALLLVHLGLPDALDFVRGLRARQVRAESVVIAITPDDRPARIHALLEAGCTDYLRSPVDESEVERRLLVAAWSAREHTLDSERDATDRALAAMRLAESEGRYRALTDATTEGVVVHEDGIIEFYNGAFARMFGYQGDELVGKPILLLHPAAVADVLRRRFSGAPRGPVELVGLRKDGSHFPVEIDVRVIDVGGRPRRVAALRDLTAQKAAEQALRESNARFELVARATNDTVYDWTIPTGAILWNEALHTLFGYRGPPEAADFDWWTQQIHPDDRERVATSLDAALGNGAEYWSQEYRFQRADGTYADVIDRGLVMRDPGGAAARMIGVMTDVTAYNQMKSRLVLADRMASVGTLAAGVAHEINNPLTWVMAKVSLANEQVAALPPSPRAEVARAALDAATDGVQRIRQIVKDLKLFSRAEEESHLPVDVRRVLDSAASIANAEIRQRARLVRAYADVPRVDANEARLGQVFLNLIINAAQAIPPGDPDANTITLATGLDPEGQVFVEVRDTGAGIPPALRNRIFDAFFTTKPPGEGTGLGLAICRQLLVQMGGGIDVESDVGVGTTFRVHLPAIAAGADPDLSELPSHLTAGPRRGRVLLVDDEQMIVTFLERVIELEHDVETFTQPRQALQRLLAGEVYDVILCDLMMPEVTGPELFLTLSRARPEMAARVVFITGGAVTPKVRAFLDETRAPVLEKPFDIRALQALLRQRVAAQDG